VSADIAHELQAKTRERPAPLALRARLVLALGPATALGGVVWALVQPWRLTLLHPHGQGFWWLLGEPPLYVVLVGLLFRLLLAPGIAEDILVETAAASYEQIGAGHGRIKVTGLRETAKR
jgi:hypothetical protein